MIYAIGDIHGRFDLLVKALNTIHLRDDPDKTIVFLGDYVDRGAESADVIDRLIELEKYSGGMKVVCLMGNHERMMLDALENGNSYGYMSSWLMNGGHETLESYGAAGNGVVSNAPMHHIPQSHIQWMKKLPLYYETEKYFFVHAGVNPDREFDNQKEKDLLWIREYFLKTDRGPTTRKHIVHGHTPHEYDSARVKHKHRRTNLDSGAVWTNILTIGIFDEAKGGEPAGYIFLEGTHDEITVKEYELNVETD